MLEFKEPEISDREWVAPILCRESTENCELCFGNLYIWTGKYQSAITNYNGFFLAKYVLGDDNYYSVPVGDGDYRQALEAMVADAEREGHTCSISGVTEYYRQKIEDAMPGAFAFEEQRNYFDYIYAAEALVTLRGKKYHSKRNHITNFIKEFPGWSYETITAENKAECLRMHEQWIAVNGEENTDYEREFRAVQRAFDHFEELELKGGLLRNEGEVIAYSFGERLSPSCFCTHIEKAYSEMRGAYPMMHQQFSMHNLEGYRLVNREEDLGLEGLRKAKLSYKPEILLVKSTAHYKPHLGQSRDAD